MPATQALRVFDVNKGDLPLDSATAAAIGASFGNGAASAGGNSRSGGLIMGDDGNISLQVPGGAAGISPGSTANDNVLATFTLPAGSFDLAGRGVNIEACGNIVNNAHVDTIKIIVNPTTAVVGSAVVGGTTIATTGPVTSSGTISGGWMISANIYKYGAAGSNTQIAIHESSQIGSTVQPLVAPSALTLPENAPIVIAITGNAATTATDIVLNLLQIFAMN
jgi:hypothetical protein